MGAEYELKYRASADMQDAIFRAYPGRWETTSMATTYYDTPSGALSANRYMLRRRLENGISVCTLKTPGTGNIRGEWEVCCESITAAVTKLCKLDCPAALADLCAEGLVPICGAEFIRRSARLELSDCTAELALDKGILFGKGKELPLCEIELELKGGSREALDQYAAGFALQYGLLPEEKSKFARALALCEE